MPPTCRAVTNTLLGRKGTGCAEVPSPDELEGLKAAAAKTQEAALRLVHFKGFIAMSLGEPAHCGGFAAANRQSEAADTCDTEMRYYSRVSTAVVKFQSCHQYGNGTSVHHSHASARLNDMANILQYLYRAHEDQIKATVMMGVTSNRKSTVVFACSYFYRP